MFTASLTNSAPAKTYTWSRVQPPSISVCRKIIGEANDRYIAFQQMSMPMRKKKSTRNSMARLKEKRRK